MFLLLGLRLKRKTLREVINNELQQHYKYIIAFKIRQYHESNSDI